MEFDFDVISNALEVLLDAILPVLAAFAAAYVRAKYLEARNYLTAQQKQGLDNAILIAVYAAEQMKAGGFISDKLDYAEQQVQSYIDKFGLDIDVHERRALIESAVKQEFN